MSPAAYARGVEDDYYEQTPEEIEAHMGPAGPVEPAWTFMRAIFRDADLAAAWQVAAESLRREMVEAWLRANATHPFVLSFDPAQATSALVAGDLHHSLWEPFADTQLRAFREGWAHFDLDRYGVGSRPRPVGVDEELVVFLDSRGEAIRLKERTPLPGVGLLMRHEPDGWRVAGFPDPDLPSPAG